MAQHRNYAQDRDLMMEAYASVRGIVPKTTSTALPRGYVLNEAHTHPGAAKYTLQGVGGMHGQTTAGDSESFDSLEDACKAAGIDPSECADDKLWYDMEDGTKEFQVGEDLVIIKHGVEGAEGEEQPSDDFFEALDDVLMITGTENAHAVVGGMEVKLGRKLSPLEIEHCHNVIQDDELPEDGEREDGTDDGECESCGGGGCEDCNGSGLESTRQFVNARSGR